jgi:hypothetical protein
MMHLAPGGAMYLADTLPMEGETWIFKERAFIAGGCFLNF